MDGAPARYRRLVVGLLSLLTVAGALQCSVAQATVTHPFLFSFTGSETPAGSLGSPTSMAVEADTGDVYIAAGDVNDKFSSSGTYICQITGAGSASTSHSECDSAHPGAPPGSFSGVLHIAVDNSTGPNAGDLYVANEDEVDKFSPSGEYLSQIRSSEIDGIAVDGGGDLWMIRRNGSHEVTGPSGFEEISTVSEYSQDGTRLLQFVQTLASLNEELETFTVDYGTAFYMKGAEEGFGVVKFQIEEDEELLREGLYAQGHLIEAVSMFSITGIATDLSTDDVYVLKNSGGQIVEHDASGAEVAAFGSTQLGGVASKVGGIVVNPFEGDIYAVYANGANPTVYVYGPAPGPRVTLKAPSDIQTKAITVNAAVDPHGADTTYRFEYGSGRGYGHAVPAVPGDAGSGTSFVPVSAAIGGLQPGTTYHYHIVATNANGTVDGADATFTTKPVPTVDAALATHVEPGAADLTAKINPKGNEAAYRIEYGTSTAYGQSTAEVPIGSGEEDVSVSRHVAGLTANTTYHWRVVVSYPEGGSTAQALGVDHEFIYLTEAQGSTGCPNEALRVGPSASLPECRAYELVTPAAKNGAVFGLGFAIMGPTVSEDGSRMIAHSIQPLGGAQSGSANRVIEGEPYALTRTAGGWTITPLAPPASRVDINTELGGNADSGAALFSGPTPPAGEDDFYLRLPSGSIADVGPAYPPSFGAQRPAETSPWPVGLTPDYGVILYRLLPRYEWPFDGTLNAESLYEYVGAGNSEPLLVGVSGGAASTRLISVCGTIAGGEGEGSQAGAYDISSDGRTVYFTALGADSSGCPAGAKAPSTDQLYARIEVSETVQISARSPSDCTGACAGSPAGDAEFQGASEDGSRVFFLDNQQLTNSATQGSGSARTGGCAQGAGCNLYLYDFSRPEGHNLVAVSAGDTSGQGPQVQGVMAISPDGSHVYFVAKGVLTTTPEYGQSAEAAADNLYVYERDSRYPEGHVSFVAKLPKSDAKEWMNGPCCANVTPDGRFLVFTSHGDLTPFDISQSDAAQVFRYDAQSEELIRVSIGKRGFNDNGNAGFADASIVQPTPGAFRSDPTMSHDGSHVFFQSPVGLTPQALNMVQVGTVGDNHTPTYAQNAYEWAQDGVGACHESTGCVYLISDGHDTAAIGEGGTSAVKLLGADATGENVFFSTTDRLVAQDTDTQLDYYDARVAGGFPVVEAPAECTGEECQGSPSPQQVFGPLASTLLSGSGNLAPPPTAAKPKPKPCAKGKQRRNGKCVSKPKPKPCSKGKRRRNGKCVSAAAKRKSRAKKSRGSRP